MSTIQNCKILAIPKIEDPRGNLSVIEHNVIPFEIKRVYYLYDVPSGAERGGHSHREQHEFLVALSGSFDVILNDGQSTGVMRLATPAFMDEGIEQKIDINKMVNFNVKARPYISPIWPRTTEPKGRIMIFLRNHRRCPCREAIPKT